MAEFAGLAGGHQPPGTLVQVRPDGRELGGQDVGCRHAPNMQRGKAYVKLNRLAPS